MNKSETVAIINDPEVTLGHLEKRSITTLNAWEINWNDLNPESNYILLGGHMGAYQSEEYPYLKSEKKWIAEAVNTNIKILGICLGSQLIADSLDGEAYLAENIEFGFKKLSFLTSSYIFDDYKNIEIFTWHRDTFKLPSKAKLIAKTSFPQIFTIKKTIGIQYHPEITYNKMINIIVFRKEKLLKKEAFSDEKEINSHIQHIESENKKLDKISRMRELENWLNYLNLE